MIRLILASPSGEPLTSLEAPVGERVLDVLDEHGAPLRTSCRAGNCGTCAVRIERGMELVWPPTEQERRTLDSLDLEPGVRLACQLRLANTPGTLQLVALTDLR